MRRERRFHLFRLRAEGRAAGGGAQRAERLDRELMEDTAGYFRTLSEARRSEYAVDETSWNDLDMDRVYLALRYTCSTPGDELLYAMLRDTGANAAELERRGRGMRAMQKHPDQMHAVRVALARLGRNPFHGACAYLFKPSGKCPGHAALLLVPVLAQFLFLGLGFLNPAFFLGIVGMFVVNLLIYYLCSKTWMKEVASIRHLASVVRAAGRLQKLLPPELEDTKRQLGALCGELKAVGRWSALFAMQRESQLDFLTDYLRIAFQLDMLCLNRLTRFFERHGDALRRLYALVGEIDVWQSVAALRLSDPERFCTPEFGEMLCVRAAGLTHPLIEHPVPNDFEWTRPTLVTGSNASGKSTFIKAMAVNAILAQSILCCTARRFSLPRARVMSSMALRDSLLNGESYFIVEIKSLKRIVDALQGRARVLCFVDEILRGTNTRERIAASSALLQYLEGRNCLCMAATHDIELTRILRAHRQIHFSETMTGGGMMFSYRLLEGPCDTQNAIALLEAMNFPPEITGEAKRLAERQRHAAEAECPDCAHA